MTYSSVLIAVLATTDSECEPNIDCNKKIGVRLVKVLELITFDYDLNLR